mmetsp:Transcript_107737/g.304780  ORF Transcript_107737/g.304780 Transcript_107737/m.304780 type:complete len:315 (-) Transcript_107737:217-1161(-)
MGCCASAKSAIAACTSASTGGPHCTLTVRLQAGPSTARTRSRSSQPGPRRRACHPWCTRSRGSPPTRWTFPSGPCRRRRGFQSQTCRRRCPCRQTQPTHRTTRRRPPRWSRCGCPSRSRGSRLSARLPTGASMTRSRCLAGPNACGPRQTIGPHPGTKRLALRVNLRTSVTLESSLCLGRDRRLNRGSSACLSRASPRTAASSRSRHRKWMLRSPHPGRSRPRHSRARRRTGSSMARSPCRGPRRAPSPRPGPPGEGGPSTVRAPTAATSRRPRPPRSPRGSPGACPWRRTSGTSARPTAANSCRGRRPSARSC